MRISTSIRVALATLSLTLAAASVDEALAGTATNILSVTANVVNNCEINSTAVLAFGAYDPAVLNKSTGSDVTGTGTLTITCTLAASTTINLDEGANAAGTSTPGAPARRIYDGTANYMNYALYQDAANTTVWANTVGTAYAYTGSGVADTLTVYGVLPKGQNVPLGNYSDTVIATVNF